MSSSIARRILILSALISVCASAHPKGGGGIDAIPRPARGVKGEGEFVLSAETPLSAPGVAPRILAVLQDRLRDAAGFTLRTAAGTGGDFHGIRMSLDTALLHDSEAYRLVVLPSAVTLTGGGEPGLFYGLQTLVQLTSPSLFARSPGPGTVCVIPCCSIDDAPRFRWRGMHLDVSRHFFPVEFIKTYIDLLAMHKLNVFHWHLTDDQGWRIEIRRYPELTRTGAWRVDREDRPWTSRAPAEPGEKATYGGFYTQEEIRDIVRYASDRYVTIVPEIEMPAHALAALAAYPRYSCTGGPFTVPPGSYWPISNIFCAGNDSTFLFLEDVLAEMMDLFPGKFIHVGGDEADKSEWKKCAKCQLRIRNEGLRDESGLQSYFMKRICAFVQSRGRRLIGWDEILEGGLPPGAAVMSWRGVEGGNEAANLGHDVVMTPGSYTYFGEYQGPAPLEPLSGGGFVPLSRVYAFDPLPDTLEGEARAHVIGGEGCLWTEYISTPGRALYMLLPRLAALSEVLWSPSRGRDWNDFSRRVVRQMERYGAAGYPAARSAYAVRIHADADTAARGMRLTLSTELPPDSIVYTTDDSEPRTGSALYTGPVAIRSPLIFRASSVVKGEVLPSSAEPVTFHKGLFRPVSVTFPATKYLAEGTFSLTDGLFGSLDHADGRWQGFEGVDFEAVVDLGESTAVSGLGARFLENTGSWIFFPTRVTFGLSADGRDFVGVGTFDIPTPSATEEARSREWDCTFPPRAARFVRVQGRNIGICPPWHPGAGGKAWLFVDELIVH